jgi:hypothetical protein
MALALPLLLTQLLYLTPKAYYKQNMALALVFLKTELVKRYGGEMCPFL